MKLYDRKSNDTRDIVISNTHLFDRYDNFKKGWEFNAETKSATDYLNSLSGPNYKFVQTLDNGVLWTENKASFDLLFKIIKGTNFVVDLHLGESE
tara:strand:- start:194 stop:478 length:285 start_codon:yes stop_codon:yes gene_type:complete